MLLLLKYGVRIYGNMIVPPTFLEAVLYKT